MCPLNHTASNITHGSSQDKWHIRIIITFLGEMDEWKSKIPPILILSRWIYLWKHLNILSFSIIYQHWDGTGSWNLSSWKTGTHLSHIINTMADDDLATQLCMMSKYLNQSRQVIKGHLKSNTWYQSYDKQMLSSTQVLWNHVSTDR